VVVDDHDMRISHAMRGEDWLPSAPKHLQLYDALGYEPPRFAHLPNILGNDHKKLSKRSGDAALLDYRENGYLPEAMINFLALLGWSLDDKTAIVSRDDLVAHFSLERVVPNPAIFDLDRLNFLNGHYIREMDDGIWLGTVAEWAERGLPAHVARPLDRTVLNGAAPLLKERVARLTEIAPQIEFLFGEDAPEYPVELLGERLGGDMAATVPILDAALLALDGLSENGWTQDAVEAAIRGLETAIEMKLRKFVAVLYVAIMGRPAGIPLFDSVALLGRDRTLERLRTARARAASHS
jgi:glutamyl-tRNA synthetase